MKAKAKAQLFGCVAVLAIGCAVLVAARGHSSNIYLMLGPLLLAASAVMTAIGSAIDAIREPSENAVKQSEHR